MLSPVRFAIYACFLTVLSATENRLSDLDRTEIQKAYQKAQLAPVAVPGGYTARSHSQEWQTRFDARGFTVQPDSGAWSWGLELKRYGFSGSERSAGAASGMSADKVRVSYRRGGLEEWFVNDAAGVEHGSPVDPGRGDFSYSFHPGHLGSREHHRHRSTVARAFVSGWITHGLARCLHSGSPPSRLESCTAIAPRQHIALSYRNH